MADIEALPAIDTRLGRAADAEMRPAALISTASPSGQVFNSARLTK
jgi:hypothetical protein